MFKKYNKIAVLICGELRQFKRTAPIIFDYFTFFSDTIDYFLTTWTTTKDWDTTELKSDGEIAINQEEVISLFRNHSLKDYSFSNKNFVKNSFVHLETSFYYRAFLAQMAGGMKKLEEAKTQQLYDLVIEIRPDLFLKIHPPPNDWCTTMIPRIPLGDQQVILSAAPWATPFWNNRQPPLTYEEKQKYPEVHDLYFISNSKVSDIITSRVYFLDKPIPYNSHRLLYEFLAKHNLFALYDPFFTLAEVVRPNVPADINLEDFPIKVLNILNKTNANWRAQV